MHIHQLDNWKHQHQFLNNQANKANEKRTIYVVLLTLAMMVVEISAGMIFNSMALLADGWHMATHAGALGLTVFAYRYARHHANDRSFTFGIGKVEILGGYSNAIILGLVALFMAYESIERLINPLEIAFDQAMLVAGLGLAVNLISAWLLQGHGHNHDYAHHHHEAHKAHEHNHNCATDHNMKAAYMHVMADALTSVLAIIALVLGKAFGWTWVDATMGLVGAFVISKWSIGFYGKPAQSYLTARSRPILLTM